LFAQFCTLQVYDNEKNPISYASVVYKGILRSTDKAGKITIPNNIKLITISHVSFLENNIEFPNVKNDTTILVYMQPKEIRLDSILVKSKNLIKYTKRKFRNINKQNSTFTLHLGTKIGIVIEKPKSDKTTYLNGIDFKANIDESNKKMGKNTLLELKIFEISNDSILPEPLNHKPIYLFISKSNKKLYFSIDEIVKIPVDGIFVTLEIPLIDDISNFSINFKGTNKTGDCIFYFDKFRSTVWDSETLQKLCFKWNSSGELKSFNPSYILYCSTR
jgi:hypothetical protein